MNFTQEIIKQISSGMKERGYKKKGKYFYYIQNDIAFCIEIDYGYLLYATFYIVPLYMPASCRYYTYGNRLNSHPKSKLPLIRKESSASEVALWVRKYIESIDNVVIPFFNNVSTPQKIAVYSSSIDEFFCPDIDIARMLLYTHLYLQNKREFLKQAEKMDTLIRHCTFLSSEILTAYQAEVKQLREMNDIDKSTVKEFFANVIAQTKEACRFN